MVRPVSAAAERADLREFVGSEARARRLAAGLSIAEVARRAGLVIVAGDPTAHPAAAFVR